MSQSIKNFNKSIEDSRTGCKEACPLWDKTFVGMDTDNGNVGQRNILFLGLNPGEEEAEPNAKRPFVGAAGQLLRKALKEIGFTSWAMVNSILCSTPNQASIENPALCQRLCSRYVTTFVHKIKPKCIVPMGATACQVFGLDKKIQVESTKLYILERQTSRSSTEESPIVLAPCVHPSRVLRKGGAKSTEYGTLLTRLEEIGGLFQEGKLTLPKGLPTWPIQCLEQFLFTGRKKTR